MPPPSGHEPVLGVYTAPTSAAAPAAQPPAPAAAPAAPPSAPAIAAAAAGPAAATAAPPQQTAPTSQPQQSASTAAPPAQQQQQAAAAPVPMAPAAAATAASAPAAGPSSAAAGAADSHPSVALFGRRVHVFTRQAEKEVDAGASAGAADEDDSFFEFTEVGGETVWGGLLPLCCGSVCVTARCGCSSLVPAGWVIIWKPAAHAGHTRPAQSWPTSLPLLVCRRT